MGSGQLRTYKLGRVTNVKVLFLVLVFVFNFDYSPFISLRDIIDHTSAGCSVNMNVVPRSTGNTNSGTRKLTLKCKL